MTTLITYYVHANGEVQDVFYRLTFYERDKRWLADTIGNRVLYPSVEHDKWREVKLSSDGSTYSIDISLSDLPLSVQETLPKEIQMKILTGAV